MIPQRVFERALLKRVPQGRCLVSTYAPGSHGYAQIGWYAQGQHYALVHRVVWEHYRGAVPKGYEVDHMCRNRRCSRLSHLRLLTITKNHSQGQLRKTHCPQGHPYDEINTRQRSNRNGRECVTCRRESNRRYRLRKRAA